MQSGPPEKRIRKTTEEIDAVLNALDEGARGSDATHGREHDRYRYRVDSLVLELEQQAGLWVRYAAPTRNISREGAGILLGRFVYPGTRCKLHLTSVRRHRVTVRGRVVRCRYIEQTGCLHELGVRFDAPIDVALFDRSATQVRALVIDADEAMHRLLEHLLKGQNVELTCLTTADEGIAAALDGQFDLVLLDLDLPGKDGLAVAGELRARHYSRPIVMMSGAATSELQTRCQQAGLSLCIAKPLRRAELLALVGSLKEEPMVSALMHDGDMAEMIDEFVASVRTRLDELQTALKASDTALLTRLVRMLKSQAGTCGFDVIAHAAGELEMLAVEGAEAARLAGKLRDLGRLCGSARAANRDQAAKNTGQCGANVS